MEKFKKNITNFIAKIYNNSFLLSLSCILIILFISFIVVHPYYGTNDDIVMKMFASGKSFAFQYPNEHLVYINILYGKVLKYLYIHCPSYQWYDISFTTLTTIASFSVIYSLVRLISNKNLLSLTIITLIATLPVFFITVQFTQIAGLLAISTIFAFVSILLKRPKNKLNLICWLFYLIFAISFSALIRFESAFMMLVYSLFPTSIIVAFSKNNNKFRDISHIAIFYVCSFLLSISLFTINNHLYSINKDWKDHYSYNTERVKLIEYNNYTDIEGNYRKELKNNAKKEIKLPDTELKKTLLTEFANQINNLNKYSLLGIYLYGNKEILFEGYKNSNNLSIDNVRKELIDQYSSQLNKMSYYDLKYHYLYLMKKQELKNNLSQLGWSTNDYSILLSMYAVNNNKYSLGNLKKANNFLNSKNYVKAKAINSYKNINNFFNEFGIIFSIELIILLAFSLIFFEKKNFIFGVLIIIQALMFLFFILLTTKYPPYRVFISLFIFNLYFILLLKIANNKFLNRIKHINEQIWGAFLIIFLLFLIPLCKEASEKAKLANNCKEEVKYISNLVNKGDKVVAFGGYHYYENTNQPFQPIEDYYKKFISLGWLSYTPGATKYFLNKYKTLDLLPTFCDNKTHMIASDYVTNNIAQYFKEEKNINVIFEKDNNINLENMYTCEYPKRKN